MEYALAPFGKYMGLRLKKEVTRFSEQAWLVLYCCAFWSLGFVCIHFWFYVLVALVSMYREAHFSENRLLLTTASCRSISTMSPLRG